MLYYDCFYMIGDENKFLFVNFAIIIEIMYSSDLMISCPTVITNHKSHDKYVTCVILWLSIHSRWQGKPKHSFSANPFNLLTLCHSRVQWSNSTLEFHYVFVPWIPITYPCLGVPSMTYSYLKFHWIPTYSNPCLGLPWCIRAWVFHNLSEPGNPMTYPYMGVQWPISAWK